MSKWGSLPQRARDVIGPVLGFCVVGYFVYHSVEGERGLTAYVRLTERIAEARAQYEEVHAERQAIERRVRLLRSDSLDADLLEERSRLILNYSRAGEIVIFEPHPSR